MKLILAFAIVCTSLSAMAECYKFQSAGPQMLGEEIFTKTPRIMCINETSTYSNIELSDGSRVVAAIEATIRRERSPQGEIVADLGQARVYSLREDLRGKTLQIKRGKSFLGEREVVLEGKRYFVKPL